MPPPLPDPLIDADTLDARLASGAPTRLIDVRWRLGRPTHGPAAFAAGRLPGALFLDLDGDLSDIGDPTAGRHPLPAPDDAARRLARAGVDGHTPVVVYDDLAGAVAARLWWMLRWLGGPPCAVLDGGIDAWTAAGHAVETEAPAPTAPAAPWTPKPDARMVATVEDLAGGQPLIDARDAARYRGETEPVDPIAGHIPGAVNAPWKGNLVEGRFASPTALRDRFTAVGVTDGAEVIVYCGSGVTACHDILALRRAGFAGARLFPGSWSAWCHRQGAPIAKIPPTSGPPRDQ